MRRYRLSRAIWTDRSYWSRKVAEKGIYPAINVFQTTSRMIDVEKIGEKHYYLRE